MDITLPDDTVLSEDGTRLHTKPHTTQPWVNRQIQAEVLDLALNVGYMSGRVLDQLVVKATPDGWLVMVKAHINRVQRVAYVSGETFGEALELAADWAANGVLNWQVDPWPPKFTSQSKKFK